MVARMRHLKSIGSVCALALAAHASAWAAEPEPDAANATPAMTRTEEITDAKFHGRSKDLQAWTDERIEQVDALLATALAAIAE